MIIVFVTNPRNVEADVVLDDGLRSLGLKVEGGLLLYVPDLANPIALDQRHPVELRTHMSVLNVSECRISTAVRDERGRQKAECRLYKRQHT